MPQHKKLSILPLRLPPIPHDLPPSMRQYLEQHHAALEAYVKSMASIDICSGLTKFSDAVNKGYFLGFTRNDTGYEDGTPVFIVGDRAAEKYFEFDGEDVRIGRSTQLIGADAYNNDSIYWHTYFDSVDSFTKNSSGTPSWGLGVGGLLLTVFDTGDKITLYKSVETGFIEGTWEKNRRFRCSIEPDNNFEFSNSSIQISTNSSTPSLTARDFGFYLDQSDDLRGFAGDGSSSASVNLNTTVTAGTVYDLEAVFTAGSKVEFFVNGDLKGSVTTNLPSSGNAFGFMSASLSRISGTASTNLRIGEWRFWQEA